MDVFDCIYNFINSSDEDLYEFSEVPEVTYVGKARSQDIVELL